MSDEEDSSDDKPHKSATSKSLKTINNSKSKSADSEAQVKAEAEERKKKKRIE